MKKIFFVFLLTILFFGKKSFAGNFDEQKQMLLNSALDAYVKELTGPEQCYIIFWAGLRANIFADPVKIEEIKDRFKKYFMNLISADKDVSILNLLNYNCLSSKDLGRFTRELIASDRMFDVPADLQKLLQGVPDRQVTFQG